MIRDRPSPLDRLAETQEQIQAHDLRGSPPPPGTPRELDQAYKHQRALDRVCIAYAWTIVAGRIVGVAAAAAAIGLAVTGQLSIGDLPALWK